MKVQDILTSKGSAIVTVKSTETIATLSELLREHRIGAAVVSNNGQTIDGVISERDIAYGLASHPTGLHALPVSELMTGTVVTCSPNDLVARVASTMLSRNIRHLPVQDDGHLIGMVSIRDILKERVDELQQKTALLHSLANKTDRPPEDRE
ncbi:MAG: CBS domain-containing protein [Hyphomicrobiaceae bacterium]